MQDLNNLKEALNLIGFVPTTSHIAFNELAYTLHASERLLYALEGSKRSTVGLLVATDLRVLYVGCNPLKESVIRSIGYTEISSLEFIEGKFEFSGTLEIKATETHIINGCDSCVVEKFIEVVSKISKEKKGKNDDLRNLGY